MFSLIKETLDPIQVFNRYLKYELKEVGTDTYTPEDDHCVFCGHKNCLRIKIDGPDSYYKCFSCDAKGDVITFVSEVKNVLLKEAAAIIAKDFKLEMPKEYSPIGEIFNIAAEFYNQNLIKTTTSYDILGDKTPLEYQKEFRKHTEKTMLDARIGWTGQSILEHLLQIGYPEDLIVSSGLASRPKQGGKKVRDFLPRNCFVYPHYVGRNVSHFTFKDPTKRVQYQLPNKNRLNGVVFYGEQTFTDKGPIYVVEGENDLLSLVEAGVENNVLAIIGQISKIQLERLKEIGTDRDVITLFDKDDAGDGYRKKIPGYGSKFKTLKQVVVDQGKDIDEYLKAGNSLDELLNKFLAEAPVAEEGAGLKVYEKDGGYYRDKFRDGVAYPIKLSNFTIQLRNIYITSEDRVREIVVVREDGRHSFPFIMTSEDKVSLRLFKIRIANAIDASWYGNEDDLIHLWETVYSKKSERCVYVTSTVGFCDKQNGWVFRNCFIAESGEVFHPDKEGIMWMGEESEGIKPGTLNSNASVKDKSKDVPKIETWMAKPQRQELLKEFAQNLALNLGSVGQALTLLGWSFGNTISEDLFDKYRCYPFLFLWGKHGKGKTNIVKWLLSIFGTEEVGYTTVPQLKTGVGFSRKLSWLSSVPVAVDEIRADPETISFYGVFRSWYNRVGRVMAAEKVNSIRTTDIKTNFIFSGQDMFTDPATRTRCIPIQISGQGRELELSYRKIETMLPDLSCIGFEWIHKSLTLNRAAIFEEIQGMHSDLLANGCEARTSVNWAMIGFLGSFIGQSLFPDFDFKQYVLREARKDAIEQESETLAIQFFNIVERLQVGEEKAKITRDHIKVDASGFLYLWFNGVVQTVLLERQENREIFSSRAIKEALREEPYFVKEDRTTMGTAATQRRVIVLRVTGDDIPEVLQNISHMAS